jgi:hypothetical protein
VPCEYVYVVPRERGGCRAYPSSFKLDEPRAANPKLTQDWVDPEKVLPLRGLKSNDKMVLCIGGPLHRVKLRRQHKLGKVKIDLIGTKPFTVPPYRGRYEYEQELDRFNWTD